VQTDAHDERHLMAKEHHMKATGAKLTHIPYKGTTQATLDVISGNIPVMFSATSLVIEQMQKIIKGAGITMQ
jgi:tripartite-type tricarboxylate transporter receptor subunit TctC